jgi:UDP-N-acetylglucosamine--N-acetylmuramyl-(pentapeptide) pyrophosphoryl-undecaprenol N-acetylglucosamine transferase
MFGCYVSAPVLAACKASGARAVLHEQNARAGRVTLLASRLGVPVACGWERCGRLGSDRRAFVGIPIRPLRSADRRESRAALGVPGSADTVLSAAAGSLGSGSVMGTVASLARRPGFETWHFLLIDPAAREASRDANVTRLPRTWDMSPVYAASDIMVTRGGAATLAEALALGIPAVSSPWRGAAGDHQMENARSASEASGGRILIWDEKSDSAEDLEKKLKDLRASNLSINEAANMLYNAIRVGEENCLRLWNFAARDGQAGIGSSSRGAASRDS